MNFAIGAQREGRTPVFSPPSICGFDSPVLSFYVAGSDPGSLTDLFIMGVSVAPRDGYASLLHLQSHVETYLDRQQDLSFQPLFFVEGSVLIGVEHGSSCSGGMLTFVKHAGGAAWPKSVEHEWRTSLDFEEAQLLKDAIAECLSIARTEAGGGSERRRNKMTYQFSSAGLSFLINNTDSGPVKGATFMDVPITEYQEFLTIRSYLTEALRGRTTDGYFQIGSVWFSIIGRNGGHLQIARLREGSPRIKPPSSWIASDASLPQILLTHQEMRMISEAMTECIGTFTRSGVDAEAASVAKSDDTEASYDDYKAWKNGTQKNSPLYNKDSMLEHALFKVYSAYHRWADKHPVLLRRITLARKGAAMGVVAILSSIGLFAVLLGLLVFSDPAAFTPKNMSLAGNPPGKRLLSVDTVEQQEFEVTIKEQIAASQTALNKKKIITDMQEDAANRKKAQEIQSKLDGESASTRPVL